MAARKPKGEQLEQGYIPGTEPPEHIKELDQSAKIYHNAMIDRKDAGTAEDEAKDSLIDKMKAHGLSIYETRDGKIVTLTETSNLRVKDKKKKDESNGK